MNVSGPFIRRPIATTLLVVGVLLLGCLGYRLLPVAALPSVDLATIQVSAQLPGAGPDVMASSVTTPLERPLGAISGLTGMNSISAYGTSLITLQFNPGRDIDAAAQDVQAALNGAAGLLPLSLMPSRPSYSKVNPADTPILILALTSDTLPLNTVGDYADTVLSQKLSQIKGVGLVTLEGGQKRAVRLQVNPTALSGLGLSLADVRTAIAATTADLPKGSLDGPRLSYQIDADDQLFDAAAYQDTIIAYSDGAPVRLRDVARAVDGVENDTLAGWYNGKPAIILDIRRQPGANIIDTVAAIRKQMPQLQAALPPSIGIAVVADRTETIRASIAEVQTTLVVTIALVVMVIFLFLRRFWATVIPSVTLPVSLIATFGVMAVAGFSVDNLSLMALTIASGFVVDDAIVMIENIVRHMEAGHPPLHAALKGARQIGFTIVSLTVSLVAVFIPLLLMGGIIGRLFREFAVTLSAAIIISAVVSLTLTPMMCARLLTGAPSDSRPNALFRWSEGVFTRAVGAYERGLLWVFRHRRLTLAATLAMLAGAGLLYGVVPKGFLPQQDTGLIIGVLDAAPGMSFSALSDRQRQIADILGRDPAVATVAAVTGGGSLNTSGNAGRLFIGLKPRGERPAADVVARRLAAATAGVGNVRLHLQPAQDIQVDTRAARAGHVLTLHAADRSDLTTWAPRLIQAMERRPELADVAGEPLGGAPQARLRINRDAAARADISLQAIDDALYDAFGQRQVATVYGQQNQYHVILEVDPRFRDGPATFQLLRLRSASGDMVPLSALATVEMGDTPPALIHEGLFPATTIAFNIGDGYALDQALTALDQAIGTVGLPPAITTSLSGVAGEFRGSLGSQAGLVLAALVTVYIVLGVLYESYIHPVTILSTLPSAGVGALLALMLTGHDLNLISLIGIVLLIGIVKKNAIMMIDFALEAQRGGLSAQAAIHQACLQRFRPIMMTTLAALLSALPLALAGGTGAELRQPLGIAIVGGLVVSQVLTLYSTPVVYLAFERVRVSFGRWRGDRDGTDAVTTASPPVHPMPTPARQVAE
ncbi:efflux RND transporter permease subunit [Nitrospirillum pindoramense]|uniref:Multidrug efflux pump n=1 Tax=Nitrospirillum amazonense TaxID=28077 RepID=A0A560GYN2_9PROT|nr:efflux RND transporter permease subunit [Nitrospirillum amazonense]TWB39136.1 multidrug efflux pump [Nitrospirillum amazonense]